MTIESPGPFIVREVDCASECERVLNQFIGTGHQLFNMAFVAMPGSSLRYVLIFVRQQQQRGIAIPQIAINDPRSRTQ